MRWLVVVSTLLASSASADEPPDEPPDDQYARALARRPLVLPGGAFEGNVLFGMARATFGDESVELYNAAPRGKYGLPAGELEAGANVVIAESDETNQDTLQVVFAAGRFTVAPDIVVGGELTYASADGETRYSPRFVVATKRRTSKRSALELAFATGLDRASIDGDPIEMTVDRSVNTFVVTAQVRAQAQVTETLAFEGRAALAFLKVFDDGSAFGQDFGIRALLSPSPALDVIAGIDLVTAANVRLYTIGIAVRRLP